jgi:hypothetical protein
MISRDGERRLEQHAVIGEESGLGSLWPGTSQYASPTISANGRLREMWLQPECRNIESSRFDIHFHLSQVGETPLATNLSVNVKDPKGSVVVKYSVDRNFSTTLKIALGNLLTTVGALPRTQIKETEMRQLLQDISSAVGNANRQRPSTSGTTNFKTEVFKHGITRLESAENEQKPSSGTQISSDSSTAIILRTPPHFEVLCLRPSLVDEQFEIHFRSSDNVSSVKCSLYPEQRSVVIEIDESQLELIQALSQEGLPRLLKIPSFPNESINQTLWRVTEHLVTGGFRSVAQECAVRAPDRVPSRRAEKVGHTFDSERFKANLSNDDREILQGYAFRCPEISETTPSGSEVAIAMGDEVVSLAIKATESDGAATRSWTFWAPSNTSSTLRKDLIRYIEGQYAVLVDPESSGYKLRSTVMSLNKLQLFHRDITENCIVPTAHAADGLETIVGFETGMYLSSLHGIDIQPSPPELGAVDSALEILSGMQNLSIELVPEEVISMRADVFNHASVGISPFGMNITLRNGLGGQMNLFLPAAADSTIDEDFRKFASNFSLQPTHGRLHVQLLLEQWAAERPGATCTCLAELPEELDLPPKHRSSRSYNLRPDPRTDGEIGHRRSLNVSTDGEVSRPRGELNRVRGEGPNRAGQRLDYIFLGRVAEIAGQVLGSPETLDHGYSATRIGFDYSLEMGGPLLSFSLTVKNERITSISISVIKDDGSNAQFRLLAASDTSEQGISDFADIRKIFEAFSSLEDELDDFHDDASEQEFFQQLTDSAVSKCLQDLFGSKSVNTHKIPLSNHQ